MEHQAGKAEAVEGFVLSFRSKNKENIGTQTSHRVWGDGSRELHLQTWYTVGL